MKSNNLTQIPGAKVALVCATLCLTLLLMNRSAVAGPEPMSKNVITSQAPEPFSWTGFYIGGHAGADWLRPNYGSHVTGVQFGAIEDNSEVSNSPSDDDFTLNDEDHGFLFSRGGRGDTEMAFQGGGQLGYQRQIGNVVLGIEGDFGVVGSDDNSTILSNRSVRFNIFDENDHVDSVLTSEYRTQTNWQGSGRVRIGYAAGRLLVYLTGGASFANVSTSVRDTVRSLVFDSENRSSPEENLPQVRTTIGNGDDTVIGWSGGIGAEYAVCRFASLGLELRHNDFESTSLNTRSTTRFLQKQNTTLDNLASEQVTFRVNILLGNLGRGR